MAEVQNKSGNELKSGERPKLDRYPLILRGERRLGSKLVEDGTILGYVTVAPIAKFVRSTPDGPITTYRTPTKERPGEAAELSADDVNKAIASAFMQLPERASIKQPKK